MSSLLPLSKTAYLRELEDLASSGLAGVDFLSLFIGEVLGEGVARRVYRYRRDEKVLKLQRPSQHADFQNQAEYALWCAAGSKLGEWLAPIETISPQGMWLLQEYCEPCPAHLIPKKVPKVLAADAHDDNWGLYEGRPVLRDYGRTLAEKMANNAQSMRLVSRDYEGTE